MAKKNPWWYYLLFALGTSGIIGTWGMDNTPEGIVSTILAVSLFLIFGFLIIKNK